MPYAFVSRQQILTENNKDITLPTTVSLLTINLTVLYKLYNIFY